MDRLTGQTSTTRTWFDVLADRRIRELEAEMEHAKKVLASQQELEQFRHVIGSMTAMRDRYRR